MGPPGVLRVPISGPNRGMFSKLNGPSPLGSGGYSTVVDVEDGLKFTCIHFSSQQQKRRKALCILYAA